MEITLSQGLLLALMTFICGIDAVWEAFFIFRPIVVCFFTGIILGDVQLGLAAGAVCELTYVGLTTVGGTVPPNPLVAGVMTTVLAYTSGVPVATALGLSLPFALLMQYINIFFNSTFSGVMSKLDDYAAKGETGPFVRTITWMGLVVALSYAIVIFLSAYAIQEPISAFVNSFPAWLVHGFEVAGGLLPGVGLGLLLRIMLKTENVGYLFIGFLIASFLPLQNVLPIAIAGAAVAIIGYVNDKNKIIPGDTGGDDDGGI